MPSRFLHSGTFWNKSLPPPPTVDPCNPDIPPPFKGDDFPPETQPVPKPLFVGDKKFFPLRRCFRDPDLLFPPLRFRVVSSTRRLLHPVERCRRFFSLRPALSADPTIPRRRLPLPPFPRLLRLCNAPLPWGAINASRRSGVKRLPLPLSPRMARHSARSHLLSDAKVSIPHYRCRHMRRPSFPPELRPSLFSTQRS